MAHYRKPASEAVVSPAAITCGGGPASGAGAGSPAPSRSSDPALAWLLAKHAMPQSERYQEATIGDSSMTKKLRAAVAAAAADAQGKPVFLVGEEGLKKDYLAAQIHAASPTTRELPMLRLDCSAASKSSVDQLVFGGGMEAGDSSAPALLDALALTGGTLLLNDVHLVRDGPFYRKLRELLRLSCEQAGAAHKGGPPLRIILTAEHAVVHLQQEGMTVIKVPPLRARPADIKPLALHFLQQHALRTGTKPLTLNAAALRHLLSYQYPLNISELKMIVERGATQANAGIEPDLGLVAAAAPSAASPAPSTTPTAQPAPCCACSGTDSQGSSSSSCCGGARRDGEEGGGCGCKPLDQAEAPPATEAAEALPLSSAHFWFATQEKDRWRVNLLEVFPLIRAALRTGVYPDFFNKWVTPLGYPILLALLFLGPQDREHSAGLNAVWAWWWPMLFLLYPFVGRWWCSVCPFMVVGEWVQAARAAAGGAFLKWPKQQAEQYGPPFLLALFTAILVWEDVWHLNNNAALTGWLLVVISAGAAACSAVFPRRFWCRHLCPIGGMNGTMARLSAVELRSSAGVCSAKCSTYSCLKGPTTKAPAEGDTRAAAVAAVSAGCPMFHHPNQLEDNKICVTCASCLSACPHDNVELRLRPPGIDLFKVAEPAPPPEAALIALLMGAVYLHRLPHLLELAGLDPLVLEASRGGHVALALVTLAAPGLLLWAAHTAAFRWQGGSRSAARTAPTSSAASLLSLAYPYVPLVWAATLAYYIEYWLAEGGHIVRLLATPAVQALGMPPDVVPAVSTHPAVIGFIQDCIMLLGTGSSLALLAGLLLAGDGRRPGAGSAGPHAAIMAGTALTLWVAIS